MIFCGFFGKKPRGVCQDGLDARENKLLTGKSQFFFEIGLSDKETNKNKVAKMKKTLIVMLLGLGFIGTQLHAEIISFNNLSANSLRRVLSTTYGTTIAKDGDLKVSTGDGGCIWIRVITVGKKKILRVYSRYSRYEKRTTSGESGD